MKKIFTSLCLSLMTLAVALADEVTFDFTAPSQLTPAVALPAASAGTTVNDVVFTSGDVSISFNKSTASTDCRIWNSSGKYDLRIYKPSTMTISVPEGKAVTQITLAGTILSSVETGTLNGKEWTGYAPSVVFTSTGTQKISSVKVVYGEAQANYVEQPVISPDGGTFAEAQTVTLTCATEGAQIFYTLDGTEPTAASTSYTGAFTISQNCTLNAVATKGDGVSTAASATFTFVKTYTSITEVKGLATAEGVGVAIDCEGLLVTAVSGKNVWLTDGTAGLLFYATANSSLKVGDKLTGVVVGKSLIYNGLPELNDADFSAVKVASSGNVVTPVEVALADVISVDGYAKYDGLLLKLTGVKFEADTLANKTVNLVDEQGKKLALYDKFNTLTQLAIDTELTYSIVGVLSSFKQTYQIYPRTEADVVAITTGLNAVLNEGGKNAVIYNLLGQRVETIEGRGIYFVNGKKVLVK